MTDVQADNLDFSIETDELPPEVEQEDEGQPDSPPEEVEVDEQYEQAPASVEEPKESSVVKQMRDELKRKERELRELRAKTAAPAPDAPKDPGTMPDIEDFDYDKERHAVAVNEWVSRKLQFDQHQQKAQAEQQQVVQKFNDAKARFASEGAKIAGFQDAVNDVASILPEWQQQMLLLKAGDVAHRIVMALHRNPVELERIARIADPVDCGMEIGKLQALAKSAPRKPKTSVKVEREVKGFTGQGKARDKTDEFLSKAFPDMKIS
jgi:hypothetical protein